MTHAEPPSPFAVDLLLRGGTVHDGPGRHARAADIAIAGDRVVAIGPDLPHTATTVVDCAGALVTPGLVDLHSHLYTGGRGSGVMPDEAHLARGVVAANDTGSAGVANFDTNLRSVIEDSRCQVSAFLNISAIGILGLVGPVYEVSELHDPADIRPDDVVAMARDNPHAIRGIKVRLSEHLAGDNPLGYLRTAIDTAERAGLPVMAHVGATACPLEEILDTLRPGDVVTHCFHGRTEAVVSGGAVIPAAWRARERGVLFDVGHGTSQFAYGVARSAVVAGFYPDTISSDLALHNQATPAYDLVTVISKLLELGLPFDEALRATTATPAHVLGLDAEGYGRLEVGGLASVTVLRRRDETDLLPDSNNPAVVEHVAVHRLEPVVTVHKGQIVASVAWAGGQS